MCLRQRLHLLVSCRSELSPAKPHFLFVKTPVKILPRYLQAEYLPEHKVHPLLSQQLDNGEQLPPQYTLAVSFPLLHDCNNKDVCAALPSFYDPGRAAAAEWPDQLRQSGIAANVTYGSQHHVKVQSDASLQVHSWPCDTNQPVELEIFVKTQFQFQTEYQCRHDIKCPWQ